MDSVGRGTRTGTTVGDDLRELADVLGIHPSGRVMARLLRTPPEILRRAVHGDPAAFTAHDQLALLVAFARVVRGRIEEAAREALEVGLTAYRRWLREGSVPSAHGPVRPIDALADPETVRAALSDLSPALVEPATGAPLRVRVVSLVRPADRLSPRRRSSGPLPRQRLPGR